MNTPGHLLLGAALFARPPRPAFLFVALLGSAIPDMSAVILVFWARRVEGISDEVIFNTLYFSERWQQVFAIDNSIPLWAGLLGIALWQRLYLTRIFAASALVHLVADMALHHDDGRSHFWPVTRWKFESPISYWDSAHYGSVVAAVLFMVSLAAFAVLIRRYQGWGPRALFAALLAGEAYFAWMWISYF